MGSQEIYLGLGSNIGDGQRFVETAIDQLGERGFNVVSRSSLYWTEPVAAHPQQWYVNAVVGGTSALSPNDLLDAMLQIEAENGRARTTRNAPRTLDIDVLFYGERIEETPVLTIPHPRLHERKFVLIPLAQIAPRWVHPKLGVDVMTLLQRCPDTSKVGLLGSSIDIEATTA